MSGEVLMSWITGERSGTLRRLRDRLSWFGSGDTSNMAWERDADIKWIAAMSSLGHLDVAWSENRWSVAPTVLTRLPTLDGLSILIGSRPLALLTAIENVQADCDVWFKEPRSVLALPLPATIYVQPGSEADFRGFYEQLLCSVPGLYYQPCASSGITASLPGQLAGLQPIAGPVEADHLELARLNVDALSMPLDQGVPLWQPTATQTQVGAVYRWRERTGLKFGMLVDGGWLGGDRAHVIYKFLEETQRSVLVWKPDARSKSVGTLMAPIRLGLPALQARAATLALGQPAGIGKTVITFPGLTRQIADKIGFSLGQSVRDL